MSKTTVSRKRLTRAGAKALREQMTPEELRRHKRRIRQLAGTRRHYEEERERVPDPDVTRRLQDALASDESLWIAIAELEILMREIEGQNNGHPTKRHLIPWMFQSKAWPETIHALKVVRKRIVDKWLSSRSGDVLDKRDADRSRIDEKRRKAGLPRSRRRP